MALVPYARLANPTHGVSSKRVHYYSPYFTVRRVAFGNPGLNRLGPEWTSRETVASPRQAEAASP
jgi:hypothetical protein